LGELEDVVGRALDVCGRGEDSPLVAAQHAQARLQVADVPQLTVDATVSAQLRRAHLRDEFLCRVTRITEASGQVALAAARMPGTVRELVQATA
jgi:hypothetical protein